MITPYDIMYFIGTFYIVFMIILFIIYVKEMYGQYRVAHDKWYDINREYKNRENSGYLFNEID